MIQSLTVLLTHYLMPLSFIYWLFRSNFRSRADWLILAAMVGIYQFYIFITGHWDWAGYYIRYFLLYLYVGVALFSLLRVIKKPWWQKRVSGGYLGLIIQVFVIILFGLLSLMAIKGYSYSDDPLEIDFPLTDGTYYIVQGGNSPVLNFHNLGKAQKFAVDISKINRWGFRANGLNPENLEDYYIYGDLVRAPINGVISVVVDNIPDVKGGEVDTSTVTGNYVGIRNGEYQVFLAHLMQGSILVKEGDAVKVGQPLGRVGSSGYTLEPQLHIHVEKSRRNKILSGKGVPLLFRGKFPMRNQLFRYTSRSRLNND